MGTVLRQTGVGFKQLFAKCHCGMVVMCKMLYKRRRVWNGINWQSYDANSAKELEQLFISIPITCGLTAPDLQRHIFWLDENLAYATVLALDLNLPRCLFVHVSGAP
jgi:hypothetical protein